MRALTRLLAALSAGELDIGCESASRNDPADLWKINTL